MTSATDNRTAELLPCPFCGGEAELYYSTIPTDGFWSCSCRDCGASTWFYGSEAKAIAAWNTRADERTCEPPYDALLRCLENDWNICASWDGLRKFWCIELTEEGVRLRDEMQNTRAERPCECGWRGFVDSWGYEPPNYCPSCGGKVVDE